MNTELVLEMVSGFLHNNALTYDDFESIFEMLSKREQYKICDILDENNIILCDEYENDQFSLMGDINDEDFDKEEEIKIVSVSQDCTEHIIQRKIVNMSNRVLLEMISHGSRQAENDLCVKNAKLVKSRASRFVQFLGNDLDEDDITQFGYIGLIDAARRFDLSRDNAFSTYAVSYIDSNIRRGLVNTGFRIRIPVHFMDFVNKVKFYNSKFEQDGYTYSERVKLISEEVGAPEEKVMDAFMIVAKYLSIKSLDFNIDEDGDTSLGDMVPYEEICLEDKVMKISLSDDIHKILETLTPKESKIIKLRFGIDCDRSYTLEEVGQEFNLTRERIRQIEGKALRKLRHPSRLKKLEGYMVG